MSPCSREHAPSSRTVLLLQEHQRPGTPCAVTPVCRPDVTTARRFLRWFGRLGRPTMVKQGMFNVAQWLCCSSSCVDMSRPLCHILTQFTPQCTVRLNRVYATVSYAVIRLELPLLCSFHPCVKRSPLMILL